MGFPRQSTNHGVVYTQEGSKKNADEQWGKRWAIQVTGRREEEEEVKVVGK